MPSVAYVTSATPWLANPETLALMPVGDAGVLEVMFGKRRIRRACLGTVLKLPLTQVTLVEGIVIAVIAAIMLARPQT
ncbi:MAG: hypothetical protein HZB38_02435 [Planctomycetes bacterium]|nr:hypothetical protein [Planctomycetota bacterium]